MILYLMKKSNVLFIIILAGIALVITLAVGKIVPQQKMSPYQLELDSLWEKKTNEREYLADIITNQRYQLIRHRNINQQKHFVEFQNGQNTQPVYMFKHNEVFIGESFKFADIDSNATKELIFVSAHNYTAYLNIFSYNSDSRNLIQTDRVRIDTIGNLNNNQDATNNFIICAGSAIYFDLQGGYTVNPRQIYKYDSKNKKLIKNRRNSIVTPDAHFFNYNNQNYLLATYVRATGNTMSVESSEAFKNSADKDSVALQRFYRNRVYEYGDFAS